MFKRLLHFSSNGETLLQNRADRDASNCAAAVAEPPQNVHFVREPFGAESLANDGVKPMPRFVSFEEVYRNATVQPPKVSYGILKVAEMISSPHLAGMSAEARRGSLLMALDAASVQIEDLMQDAMVRQRALNEYEQAQEEKLRVFESGKAEENNRLQAELDRITTDYMNRMQANLDETARQEDNLRAWQKRKMEESQRIAQAAALCAPQSSPSGGSSLTAVLARCGTEPAASRRPVAS